MAGTWQTAAWIPSVILGVALLASALFVRDGLLRSPSPCGPPPVGPDAGDHSESQVAGEAEAIQQTRRLMRNVAAALALSWIRTRRLPPTLNELVAEQPAGWEFPLPSEPRDAWGNQLEYRLRDMLKFQLRSLGPDGLPETGDDIVLEV